MRDLAAVEIRTLHRKLNQVGQRLSRQLMNGKVHPGSQDMDKRTIRLELDTDPDGNPVLSPHVRWQEPGAGDFKVHATPADKEQMTLQSPSGTIGTASLAVWATYDDDNEPPSSSKEEVVMTIGETKAVLRADKALVKSEKVVVDSGNVHLGSEGGPKVARVGDHVKVGFGSSAGLHPIVEGSSKVRATG